MNRLKYFSYTNNQLEALVESAKALKKLKEMDEEEFKTKILTKFQSLVSQIRERNRLQKHTLSVNSVSFSPTDQIIASASSDKTIILWSLQGTVRKILKYRHTDKILRVNFSSDGQYIVSASADKTVILWDQDGNFIKSLSDHEAEVKYAVFGQDNKSLISVSLDGTIRLWKWQLDSENRINVKTITSKIFTRDVDRAFKVSFSRDNNFIASINNIDESIKIWKLDGTEVTSLKGHKVQVNDLSFSPDGKILVSASRDRTVRIWDTNINKEQIDEINYDKVCIFLENYLYDNPIFANSKSEICPSIENK